MTPTSGTDLYDPASVLVPRGHLIGDRLLDDGLDGLAVRRPSDGRVHGDLPIADEALVDRAVAAASTAHPVWRGLKPGERGRLMRRWADLVDAHRDELARIESVVSSRPMAECLAVDVPTASEYLRFYGEWCDKIEGAVTASGEAAVSLVLREPYGVVAIITPWNFPLILSTWKIAPAIAAGNCVVLKPSELTPYSMTRLAELALQAGLPPGVVNVVHGEGAVVGRSLTTHPRVAYVSFTGSTAVGGRIMADVGLTGLKPVSLELGGKSPQLVFGDCHDLDTVADHVTWGITRNAGQLCYAGSRLVVQREVADDLTARIAARMGRLRPGPTWRNDSTLSPIISRRQADRMADIVERTVQEGAVLLAGGKRIAGGGGDYFEPTILTGLTEGMTGHAEEVFGPVLGVQAFDTDEEGVAMAQHPVYGLTASVFSRDGAKALRAAKAIGAGTVWINRWGRTAEMMTSPFGGYGRSSFGKESGRPGIENFTRQKAVWIDLADGAELAHSAGSG